jgi:hypothetical protein
MAKTFEAQVDDIVKATDKRMTALMRESIQDVIEIAQTPTAKGGKMRVDTGFLRASGQPSLNGMPSGPSRGEPDKNYDYDEGSSVQLTLAQMKLGAVFHFGWTAAYARYREAYDGFLESAAMQWQSIVTKNCEKIRERIKS